MYCEWCQQISNFLRLRKFFQLNFLLLLSRHRLLSYAILLKSLFFLSLYLLLQLLFFLHLLLILFLFFFATYFSFSSTTARSLTPSSYPPPPSHLHLILLFLLPSCYISYLPQRLLCLIHSPSYYRISTFPVTSSCPSTTSSFIIPIPPTFPPPLP